MKKKKPDYSIFSGLVFWGSEHFPGNLRLSINDIREWAYKNKILLDESQIVVGEILYELNNCFKFKPEDKLSILMHLYQDEKGELNYLEYPYIPVKTLFKHQAKIEIVYWQMLPKITNSGISRADDELRFGFLYPGATFEFASMSYAKVVFKKFFDLFNSIQNEYDTKVLPNGFTDITVDGSIKAKLFKTGQFHDVELLR